MLLFIGEIHFFDGSFQDFDDDTLSPPRCEWQNSGETGILNHKNQGTSSFWMVW
jgi:hypothetical protein